MSTASSLSRQQLLLGGVLALLLVATRGHHFATANLLPSASWAAFFLAGMYLRRTVIFGGLLAIVAAVDYGAIVWGGVDGFCVSPAYAALLPAYAALWLAGRGYATRCGLQSIAVLPLAAAVVGSALLGELISSGAFYAFSGRFAEPSLAEFALRMARYFPASLLSLGFWVTAAAAIHVAVAQGGKGLSLFRRCDAP